MVLQIGGSLGLRLLVLVFDTATDGALDDRAPLAHPIEANFSNNFVPLFLAAPLVTVLNVQSGRQLRQAMEIR